MADLKEQCICVKFCFRLGKTASETHEMLKTAFGDNAKGRTQTFDWFSRFKRVETSVEDSERSGRPSTGRTGENVENVCKVVNEDRRNTITEISGRLGLSYGTCQPKTSGKMAEPGRILHHDNAPAHTALSVQRFLASKNMAVVPHPPYSPNLAPCDFLLFTRMKSKLKGCRFQDVTEIQEQSLTVLHAIPESHFQRCFQQWQKPGSFA
jgi:hypothetical protein